MPQVVLVSWHYYGSKRKAGFHWLARAYEKAGWDVLFITASISSISRMRRDSRFEYPVIAESRRVKPVSERISSSVWYTPWHPADLRIGLANVLARPLFARYGSFSLGEAEERVRAADLVIVESTCGIMLFDRLKALAPGARFVYRVSDDLRMLRNHPIVREYEAAVAPRFDLVSSPCAYIHRYFAHLPNAEIHVHGLNTEAFDQQHPNPYPEGSYNFVFAGILHVDYDFLDRASRLFPEATFNLIGPARQLVFAKNIVVHAEMPFAQTVPYIQHAQCGLAIPEYTPGCESFTDSLKVLQYVYCKKPYVAPDFVYTDRPNLFCYHPGDDESIRSAIEGAMRFDASAVEWEPVRTWDDLAAVLAGDTKCPKSASA